MVLHSLSKEISFAIAVAVECSCIGSLQSFFGADRLLGSVPGKVWEEALQVDNGTDSCLITPETPEMLG